MLLWIFFRLAVCCSSVILVSRFTDSTNNASTHFLNVFSKRNLRNTAEQGVTCCSELIQFMPDYNNWFILVNEHHWVQNHPYTYLRGHTFVMLSETSGHYRSVILSLIQSYNAPQWIFFFVDNNQLTINYPLFVHRFILWSNKSKIWKKEINFKTDMRKKGILDASSWTNYMVICLT